MVNAQEYLDKKFPRDGKVKHGRHEGKKRKDITELDITNKQLQGSLKLEEFTNLESFCCWNSELTKLEVVNCPQLKKINCNTNQLTNLTIINCPNLAELYFSNNYLTNLNFLNNLNTEKLECLDLSSNNLRGQELSAFSRFVNLKSLSIGN